MSPRLKRVAKWGLGALLLGAVVVSSGVIPIYASADHPEPFASILGFAKRRSFATYSLGVTPPERLEEDEALVLRGAGHYEQGCRFCHGVPWDRPPWARDALSPPPPELDRIAEQYDAAELYLIIDHGVVFTAMPAWPDRARNDEPWALVAFLRSLPEMGEARYRALTEVAIDDDAEVPDVVRARCVQCHGVDGRGRLDAFPILAGQREAVLEAALVAYANNDRHSGFMEVPASSMSAEQMREAAAYYAALPGLGMGEGSGDDDDGARIAREGLPDRLIPPCASCHGPAEHGHATTYPILAGQNARYIREQLEIFEDGTRGGSPSAALMDPVASHVLRPEERRAIARYYEVLGR